MELVQHGGAENFRDAGGAGCTVMLDAIDSSQARAGRSSHTSSTSAIVTQGLSTPAAVTCVTEKDGLVTIVAGEGGRALKISVDRSSSFLYTVRIDRTNSAKRLHGVQGTYFDLNALRRDSVQALHQAEMLPDTLLYTDPRFAIGYIRPGHGAKGQKVELVDDDDLISMYKVCRSVRRQDIMLWYSVDKDVERPDGMYLPHGKGRGSNSPMGSSPHLRPKKRAKVDTSPKVKAAASTKNTSLVGSAMSHMEVELVPQANSAAATMNWPVPVASDLVSCVEEPLAVSTTSSAQPSLASSSSVPSSALMTTLERANARKTLIEQLRMWFDLYSSDAVPVADYEYHRQKILQDMDNL